MYTLEVAGKPVVIINAGSLDEADAIFHSDWFRRDLMAFETEDGDDLWNGSDELSVRQALPDEIARFEVHQAKALRNEGADHSAPYAVFLITVSDATDELD